MQVRTFERYIALKHIFLSILKKARSIIRICSHNLRIKRQWSEWKTNSGLDNKRSKYNLLCLYIDVLRPLTNDLWVFLFQTIDAEYVKWASPARTYT